MRTYTTRRVTLAGTLCLIILFQPFAPWAQTAPDKSVRVAQGGQAPAGICHCCGRPTCPCKAWCGGEEKSKCDKEALAKAQVQFKNLLGRFRNFAELSDDLSKRSWAVYQEENKLFNDFFKDLVTGGLVKIGSEVFKLPPEIARDFKVLQIQRSNATPTEKILKLSKVILGTVAKGAGYAAAAE